MTGHLDVDALADALAAESDGQPLPEHLQTCSGCASALAELRTALGAVATDLAGLPPVPPVPQALERSVAPTPPVGATTVLPEVTSLDARPRSSSRWLLVAGGIAAAAVLVVGGGLLLASNSTDSSSQSQSAASRNRFPISATGADYRSPAALQAALPQLLKGRPEALDSVAAPTRASGVTVPKAASNAAPNAAPNAVADPLARLRTTQGLASCIASLTDPSDPGVPLALDYASYRGQPALVVVLPAAKPSKVDIWVVGADCRQPDSDLLVYVKADRPA
jgi:hypothetical protein